MKIVFSLTLFLLITSTGKSQRRRKKIFDLSDSSSRISDSTSEYYDDVPFDKPKPESVDLRGQLRQTFAPILALEAYPSRNLISSPLSALMPIAKLGLGLSRSHKSNHEITRALGVSRPQIKSSFKRIISQLEKLKGVTLKIASRIYIAKDKQIRGSYKKHAEEIFKSSIKNADFSKKEVTATKINSWIAAKTGNKIHKIIKSSDLRSDMCMIIVNAIYFTGMWKKKFEQARPVPFFSPSGKKQVNMMNVEGMFAYNHAANIKAEVLQIPYEGNEASMLIILPSDNNGLPVLLKTLKSSPQILNKIIRDLVPKELSVDIPKFKIETPIRLDDIYQQVGLKRIFDEKRSGLEKIVKGEQVYVSKAVQRAFIEVDERGTKAAAATGTNLKPIRGMQRFNANRPFLFYILAAKQQLFGGIYLGF